MKKLKWEFLNNKRLLLPKNDTTTRVSSPSSHGEEPGGRKWQKIKIFPQFFKSFFQRHFFLWPSFSLSIKKKKKQPKKKSEGLHVPISAFLSPSFSLHLLFWTFCRTIYFLLFFFFFFFFSLFLHCFLFLFFFFLFPTFFSDAWTSRVFSTEYCDSFLFWIYFDDFFFQEFLNFHFSFSIFFFNFFIFAMPALIFSFSFFLSFLSSFLVEEIPSFLPVD